MSAAIVWFRRDLRLGDNPALAVAVQSGLPIVALYIHAPEEEGEWRSGAATNWWLQQSLIALDAGLREHGGRLIIRVGASLDTLRDVITETGATELHWNRLYEPAVVARDQQITSALRADGLTVESHNAALFVEPWQVQIQTGQPYRVFTPFWRNAVAMISDVLPSPVPSTMHFLQPEPTSIDLDQLGLMPGIAWYTGVRDTWTPGEQGASRHLADFLDEAEAYSENRNRPDLPGTSMLSPHLHFGEISPRQILAALQGRAIDHRGYMDRVEHFVRELGWREFAHHLLFHFPATTNHNLNANFDAFPWAEVDPSLLAAWQRGRTGIPIVDAGMRELWQTGWMHNRVRMIVASLLTKNLRYHWSHGARWFWDTLVDADLASNTLGWQWSAGTGADAAPYFRVFNPMLQGERFDPHGSYVKRYVPELALVPAQFLHKPWTLKPSEQATFGVTGVYARPLVDLARTRDSALAAYASIKRS